jgi:hypothetical protein
MLKIGILYIYNTTLFDILFDNLAFNDCKTMYYSLLKLSYYDELNGGKFVSLWSILMSCNSKNYLIIFNARNWSSN